MQPYTTPGQVVAGPSASGPGSFFVKGSASVPDGSEAAPQGQVTFSNPPSSETIVATTNNGVNTTPPAAISWVDLHYALTVPAGGSVPLGFTYSNGYTAALAQFDAAVAQTGFRPTVSITSPKSGIDTGQPSVNVTGTAADATGLSGVTVNGHAVTVAPDGSWNTVVELAPGVNAVTVLATNVFGNTAQAAATVVYVPPPAVAGLHQAHRKWRESGRRGRRGHPKPPIGTTFSWSLNEPAKLRFVFTTQAPGRRAAGACVAQNRRNRHHQRCLRTITVGTHNASAGSGAGKWSFKGLMANGRKLKPGAYTVTVVATNPTTGAQSSPARLRFTIVK
jgi:hypothetical protein